MVGDREFGLQIEEAHHEADALDLLQSNVGHLVLESMQNQFDRRIVAQLDVGAEQQRVQAAHEREPRDLRHNAVEQRLHVLGVRWFGGVAQSLCGKMQINYYTIW